MSFKVYSNYDFGGLQLLNAVMHSLGTAPSGPVGGQFYYNTGTKSGFVWNGTAWRPTDAALLTDGSIPIAGLAVNPLLRANHTGTQLASTISDLASTVKAYSLDQFAAPVANVSFNSFRLTTLADPTNPQDAATKNYVDGAVQSAAAGIDSKPSVRMVFVGNVATLSGLQNTDGLTAVAGDRALLTGQTTASQNGVYVQASGAWTRAADADQTGEVTPGAFWFVEEGTTYGKSQWRCNNTGTITLGTTAIAIVQFGAASAYTASNGVVLTGSNFSAVADPVAGGGILISSAGIKVDAAVFAKSVSGTITHDGSTTSFPITHNIGKNVIAEVFDSGGNRVGVDIVRTSVNAIAFNWAVAQVNGTAFAFTIVG